MFISMTDYGMGHALPYTNDNRVIRQLENDYDACLAAYITDRHQTTPAAKRNFVARLTGGIFMLACAVLLSVAMPTQLIADETLLLVVPIVLILAGITLLQGVATSLPSDYDRLRYELEGTIQNLLRSGKLVDLSLAKQLVESPDMQQVVNSRPIPFDVLLRQSRLIVTQRLLMQLDKRDEDYWRHRTGLVAVQDQAVAAIRDWLKSTQSTS